ncbi:hypothetical protein OH77DRAFT_1383846, partial [Trametes cingulata]
EYQVLRESLSRMLGDLRDACHQSLDPPDSSPLIVAQSARTGGPGRPRLEINPRFLEFALDLRGPTQIAEVLGCHPRTVRRRAIELGLAQPAPPVFSTMQDATGGIVRAHTSSTNPVSLLTDEELDAAVVFVTHAFVDGHARFVTGIRVHTNNRAATVLALFL